MTYLHFARMCETGRFVSPLGRHPVAGTVVHAVGGRGRGHWRHPCTHPIGGATIVLHESVRHLLPLLVTAQPHICGSKWKASP